MVVRRTDDALAGIEQYRHSQGRIGLEGLLGAQSEDDVTTTFLNNDEDKYDLTIEQQNPGAQFADGRLDR
ncbi:hypothetical protein C8039_01855 [Halogeometricum sp. wsp3]|nr:hypothetical protein C8039_01855 [Halogeometricum sp. wsp3]